MPYRRREAYALLLTVAAELGLLFNAAAGAAATPRPSTHVVAIDGVQFEPQVLEARVGDTIVWINRDPFPHTATAEDKQFDSGEIAPGRTWKFTVRRAGVFPYVCKLHPNMRGTLRVQ
jgi:plastocyanin